MMDNNVVAFPEKHEPHMAGEALCLACKHEWVAVVPTGAISLECPSCKTERGVYKYQIAHMNEPMFACGCGCHYFVLDEDGPLCCLCGLTIWPWGE